MNSVGVPRIALGSHKFLSEFPRDSPCISMMPTVGVPRIALGSHAPEACILLLYYTPTVGTIPKRVYYCCTTLRDYSPPELLPQRFILVEFWAKRKGTDCSVPSTKISGRRDGALGYARKLAAATAARQPALSTGATRFFS